MPQPDDWFAQFDKATTPAATPASTPTVTPTPSQSDLDWFSQFDKPKQAETSIGNRVGQFANAAGVPTLDQARAMVGSDVDHVRDIYNAVKDGRYGHAAAAAGQYLLSPFEAMSKVGNDQMSKMVDAFKRKDYGAMGAHALASTVPFTTAPNIANAAETMEGDKTHGADPLGGVLQMAGGGLGVGIANQPIADAVRAAGVKASPTMANPSAGNPAQIIAHEANQSQVAKAMTEIYKPDQPQKAYAGYRDTTLPLLKEAQNLIHPDGKPLTHQELPEAIDTMMEANRSQMDRYMTTAQMSGLKLKGDPIADAQIKSIPEQLQTENPDGYQKLVDQANVYRGKEFTPAQLLNFNETNNANLKALYDKYSIDQNTILTANASKAMQAAKADATRGVLYDGVNKSTGLGPEAQKNIQDLQNRYGALAQLRDQHKNFMDDVYLKPAPPPMSLGDAVKSTIQEHNIYDILMPLTGAALDPRHKIGAGLGFGALASRDIGKIIQKMQQPGNINDAIKLDSALAKNNATPLNPIDEPKMNALANTPGDAGSSKPGDMFAEHAAGELAPQNYGRDVKPLGHGVNVRSDMPYTLKPTDAGRTDWQRNLFPEDKERPALPSHNYKLDLSKYFNQEP